MNLKIDQYDKDLLIETIEYRLDNDEDLIFSETLKDNLQEMLRKLEENEYL